MTSAYAARREMAVMALAEHSHILFGINHCRTMLAQLALHNHADPRVTRAIHAL